MKEQDKQTGYHQHNDVTGMVILAHELKQNSGTNDNWCIF